MAEKKPKKEWSEMNKMEKTFGTVIFLAFIFLVLWALFGIVNALTGHNTKKTIAITRKSQSHTSSPKASLSPSTKTVDVNQVKAALVKEETYAINLYNQGIATLGTYQYPNAEAGLAAFNDPNSPASKWSKYDQGFDAADAVANTNAQNANNDAANAYFNTPITPPAVIDDLDNLDAQIMSDISTWKEDATSWQISTISTSRLNSDEQKVQQDFAQAQSDINNL